VDITLLSCRLLFSVCHDHCCMFQLQTEFKRFSTVDKNWRATLLAAKAQPQVCFLHHKIHFAFSWSYDCYWFVYHQKSFVFVTFPQYHAWMIALKECPVHVQALRFCANEKLLEKFQESMKVLELIQRGLTEFLETKRRAFSRFYFLSDDELLEVCSFLCLIH
jgi:hypothetical protein